MIGTLCLILALVFTVGHGLADLRLAYKHAVHPKDTLLTWASISLLTGHVIFTGELVDWLSIFF